MNFDDSTYKLIEAYLHNSLSKSEKDDFEKRLKKDVNLNRLVKEMKEMMQLFGEEGINLNKNYRVNNKGQYREYKKYFEGEESEQLNQLLNEIGNKSDSKKEVIKLKNRFNFIRVAAAILILAICIPLALKFTAQTPNKLYTSNFNPEKIEWIEKGDKQQIKTDAQYAFNSGDFEKAQTYLASILEDNPNDYETILFCGIAFQELDKFENAKEQYQKIINSNALLKDDAYWYLALIEVKHKRYDISLSYLNKIQKNKTYDEKVSKLKKKVSRLKNQKD